MKINLIDTNEKIVNAWKECFSDIENVNVYHDSIFNIASDAIISPANSFGYMNGGLDFTISKNLGWHIEKRLQDIIRSKFYGELLIGQATLVETDHKDFPYLISAPTMRTPMTIIKSPNVYLATKAIFVLVKYGHFEDGTPVKNKVKSVAIPGLGTGIGQVPPIHCARQMRLAYEDVFNERFVNKESWDEMCSNYAYFYTQEERDLKTKFN